MTIKSGWKTTEFWMAVLAGVLVSVWSDFPKESFAVLIAWVMARIGEKTLGPGIPKKPTWRTTEFWVSISFVIAQNICLQLGLNVPWETIIPIIIAILGRVGIKVSKDFQIAKPVN